MKKTYEYEEEKILTVIEKFERLLTLGDSVEIQDIRVVSFG